MVLYATSTGGEEEKTEAACDVCYGQYGFQYSLTNINADMSSDPLIYEGCTNPEGPTEICMQSTEMANARAKFEACAGYDILFEGPMCTAEQVDMVEALVPSPFYTFAHCEYNPQTLFCSAIAGYMQAISDLTDKECAACYSEFKEALSVRYALAESELTDVDVCAEDVLAEACLVYLTEALRNFETCAGKAMIIRGPN